LNAETLCFDTKILTISKAKTLLDLLSKTVFQGIGRKNSFAVLGNQHFFEVSTLVCDIAKIFSVRLTAD